MRALLFAALLLALAAPAAEAAQVQLLVVGKDGRTLAGPRTVTLATQRVRADGGSRCTVPAGTPLAALAATRLSLGISGGCGSSLYVHRVGAQRARGQAGWVYKVGRRAGTASAADPSGPFGSGRLRGGERITWFWCVRASACQRTLEVTPGANSVRAGAALRVTVVGYDDNARGRAVAGATVRLGAARATTRSDGTATLTARGRGTQRLTATARGMVRAFPVRVAVR